MTRCYKWYTVRECIGSYTIYYPIYDFIPDIVQSFILLFVDDTKIYSKLTETEDQDLLQSGIDMNCFSSDHKLQNYIAHYYTL